MCVLVSIERELAEEKKSQIGNIVAYQQTTVLSFTCLIIDKVIFFVLWNEFEKHSERSREKDMRIHFIERFA